MLRSAELRINELLMRDNARLQRESVMLHEPRNSAWKMSDAGRKSGSVKLQGEHSSMLKL